MKIITELGRQNFSLYDKRDYDYYNPKPYLEKLLSMRKIMDMSSLSWNLDSDIYKYLFTQTERITDRVLVDNVIDIILNEHIDRVIGALQDVLDKAKSELINSIYHEHEKVIERNLEAIKDFNEVIEHHKKLMKEKLDVLFTNGIIKAT